MQKKLPVHLIDELQYPRHKQQLIRTCHQQKVLLPNLLNLLGHQRNQPELSPFKTARCSRLFRQYFNAVNKYPAYTF